MALDSWDVDPIWDEEVQDEYQPEDQDNSGLSAWDVPSWEQEDPVEVEVEPEVDTTENVFMETSKKTPGLWDNADAAGMDNQYPEYNKADDDGQRNIIEQAGDAVASRIVSTGKGLAGGFTSFGAGVGTAMQMMGMMMDDQGLGKEFMTKQGKDIREYWGDKAKNYGVEEYDINPLTNMSVTMDPGFWTYHLARQAPMVVGSMAGGITAGGIAGGIMMGGDTFNDMKTKGFNDESAAKAASVDMVLGSVLERFGLGKILSPYGKVIARGAKGMAAEGGTEMAQNLSSDIQKTIWQEMEKGSDVEDIQAIVANNFLGDLYEAAGAGIVGMGMGGGISTVTGQRYSPEEITKAKEDLIAQIEQEKIDRVTEEAKAEINGEMTELSAEFLNSTQEMNQEGLTPWKGTDVMPDELKRHVQSTKVVDQPTPGKPTTTDHLLNNQPGDVPKNVKLQYSIAQAQSSGDQAVGLLKEGLSPQEVMVRLVAAADQRRVVKEKSAEKSAEVFTKNGEGYLESLISNLELRDSDNKEAGAQAVQGLKDKQVVPGKSAEGSAEVIGQEGVTYVEDILNQLDTKDDVSKAEGAKLVKALQDKKVLPGKSAEESADILEDTGRTWMEDLLTALESRDGKAVSAAARIVNSLKAKRIKGKTAEDSGSVFSKEGNTWIEDLLDNLESKDETKRAEAQKMVDAIKNKTVIPGKSATATGKVFQEAGETYIEGILDDASLRLAVADLKSYLRQGAVAVDNRVEAKSAAESIGALDANRTAGLADVDQKVKAGIEQDRVKAIQGLTDTAGTNAQQSAEVLTQQSPEVEAAKVRLSKAMREGDNYAVQRAQKQLAKVLESEGVTQESAEPKTYHAEPTTEVAEVTQTKVSPNSTKPAYIGTVEDGKLGLASRSPEMVLEEQQETANAKQDKSVSLLESPDFEATTDGIDAPVRQLVDPEGQALVQAIINGDRKGIDAALDNFRVADRQKAYKQATKDAVKVAVESGVASYNIDTIKFNADQNKEAVAYTPKKTGDVRWSSKDGVHTGVNESTGEKYTIFKAGHGEYLLRKGKTDVGTFKKLSEAKAATDTVTDSKYIIEDTEEIGRNRWEVVDKKTGHTVDPKKPGSEGVGFKNKSDAQRFMDKLEGKEETKKVEKSEISSAAKDYAQGKAKKAPVKAQKGTVVRRKKKTDTSTRANQNVDERARLVELSEENLRKEMEDLNDLKMFPENILSENPRLQSDLRKGTKADFIAKHGSKQTQAAHQVLEMLLGSKLMEGVKVRVVDRAPGAKESQGKYSSKNDEVVMFTELRDGEFVPPEAFAATLLHEMVHAVTFKKLKANPKITAELDELRQDIAKGILDTDEYFAYSMYKNQEGGAARYNRLDSEARENLGVFGADRQRLIYALLSNDELLANATHPDIQTALEDMPATFVSKVMAKIKSIMRKVMGWDAKEYNAYHQIMETIGRIANETSIHADGHFESVADFQENIDVEKLTMSQVHQLAKDLAEKQGKATDYTTKRSIKILERMKDSAMGINSRLEAISEALAYRMRSAEAQAVQRNGSMSKVLRAYDRAERQAFNKNPEWGAAEKALYDQALINGEMDILKAFFKEGPYGKSLHNSYKAVKAQQAILRDDLISIGMLDPNDLVENYWPREVKDLEGLIRAMAKDKDQTFLEREIVEAFPKLKKLGVATTLEEARKHVLGSVIKTGRYPASMRVAKATKQRKMPKVKAEYMKYYRSPVESMANHIEESNEVIAMRKMIGDTNLKQATKDLRKLNKRLLNPQEGDNKVELELQALRLAESIDEAIINRDHGVNGYVADMVEKGEISKESQDEVVKLIRARLTQQGVTSKTLRLIREIGLGAVLGHFTNTLTQLKDPVWMIYRHGVVDSAKAMMQVVLRQNDISAADMDLQRAFNDFRSQKGFSVNTLFKMTGFSALDNMTKTANMQAVINKFMKLGKLDAKKQAEVEAKIREKYEGAWGPDLTNELIADFKSGTVSDAVKTFAITELSKDVPVFLSELPVSYNQGGNWRMLYTLKSYAVKAMDNTYRDGIKLMIKGKGYQKVTGFKNFAKIMILHALIGGGVEELKDWLLGRETPFVTNAVDEVLSLFFLNKYTMDQASGGKAGDVIKDQLFGFPIFDIMNSLTSDVSNLLSGDEATYGSLKYLPFMKDAYSRLTPEGKGKQFSRERKAIFGRLRDEVLNDGKVSNELRKEVRQYNTRVKGTATKAITYETIKRNRRRYLNEAKDNGGSIVGNPLSGLGDVIGKVFSPSSAHASWVPREVTKGTTSFIDVVAMLENPSIMNNPDAKVTTFEDIGKGTNTLAIGYGHRLTAQEKSKGKVYGIEYKGGISSTQAKQILEKDLMEHEKKAKAKVGRIDWARLDPTSQMILTEYSFNGALNGFPKLRKALVEGDYKEALKEYKRYWTDKDGSKVENTKRNKITKELLEQLV